MTPAARERAQVRTPMLFMSAAAWILLLLQPAGGALASHCSPAVLGTSLSAAAFAKLAPGWALMLAAMMLPLLIAPVRHIRDRSLARRRARAIGLFLAAYAGVWMAAGAVLISLSMAVRSVVPASSAAIAFGILIALAWESSPAKQRCVNRGHAHRELAAFGRAADLDALRFGLAHALWCVGSCWAVMFLPLLFLRGHLAAMAAVSLWLFARHLDRPTPPRWRFRGPAKALRLALAQW
jgi:predicted metal-binding membrane protein